MGKTLAALLALAAMPAAADQVGKVGVDWVGNDIVVEAFHDPKVPGVTCHLSYFERSTIDRLRNGNWFEDPSNSAIECSRTGPVVPQGIARGQKGEAVFDEGRSLIFKSLRVTRIWDEANGVLIYLVHANQVAEGSAKMSISTVPVDPAQPKAPAGG